MSDSQRCVVAGVVRGVVADDVDDRRPGPSRVVQVGQPVAQSRSEVQQRRRRASSHPAVPVGRARGHALEEAEHAAHGGHVVEGGDEVHLRGAGVGEADVDAGVDQGREQGAGAVHEVTRVGQRRAGPSIRPGPRIPAGSKACFMERISSSAAGSASLQEVRHLLRADAVLAGDRAPGLDRRPEDLAGQLLALLGVGLEHRQVDVAVADVSAAR